MDRKQIAIVASLVCGVAAAISACPLQAQEAAQLTEEERQLNLESFDQIWSTINDQYWDPKFGGLDWQAVRDELRPEVEAAGSMAEARQVMRDLIARLGKSHFAIFPADIYKDMDAVASQEGVTGVDLRVIDGHALVTSVVKDSPADKAGVRSGWEIIRVGEVDILAKLKQLTEELEDDSKKPLRLAYAVIPRLTGPIGEDIAVAFLDGEGHTRPLDIRLAEPRGKKSILGNLGEIRVWIDVKTLDENTGYIAFSGFADPLYVMKTFNDAMESFMTAEGIIIDLRGNSGGLGAMAMGMVGWLVKGNPELGKIRMRDNELKLVVQSRPETYDGPVAVLVDGLSGSASEFFSGGLQELGRACIVGSRTKGEALPGQFTTLPNGDVFMYATANFTSASGSALEGVGVTPDIQVLPTRDALLQGRDLALEAAVAWIKEDAGEETLLDREGRRLNLESFDVVWSTVKDKHYDPELGGIEWDAVREELRPKVERAFTMSKARSLMREMLSRLDQSHFQILSSDLYGSAEETEGDTADGGVTGIDVRVIEGRALVVSVDPDSPAHKAGVRPGWEIVLVGQDEVESLLQPVADEYRGKTWLDAELAYTIQSRLAGRIGETVKIEFLDGDNRATELELGLVEKKGKRAYRIGEVPPHHVWFEARTIHDSIGYIAFDGFSDIKYMMTRFNGAMESFLTGDGVIIDLRGNGGGLGEMAAWMAAWFVAEGGRSLGTMYTRDNEMKLAVVPRAVTYDGPLAILVDGLSASTSEILSGGLKDIGRARIFGSRTAGASQPADVTKLPNGDRFKYAVAKHVSPTGEAVEGYGVLPDVQVVPSREDLLAGRDPVLEAAVVWIENQ